MAVRDVPVDAGQQLGVVKIMLDGSVLDERMVLATENIEPMNFWNAFLILIRRIVC